MKRCISGQRSSGRNIRALSVIRIFETGGMILERRLQLI